MNSFSNFSSVNGWLLPGSGAWASQSPELFYVDCEGNLWVPCTCGCTGATGGTGSSEPSSSP